MEWPCLFKQIDLLVRDDRINGSQFHVLKEVSEVDFE